MTSAMRTNMWSGVPIMVVLDRWGFIIVSLCNTAEADEHGYRSCQYECAFRAEL